MKSKYFYLLPFFLLLPFIITSDAKDKNIKQSLDKLYAAGSPKLVVSLGNFTYGDNKMGSEFSKYLEDCLSEVIIQCPQYELFAKNRLEEILEAQELNLSDLTEEPAETIIGRLKGVKALLSGRFYKQGKDVKVFVELIDIIQGTYYGKTSFVFPAEEIGESVSVISKNYDDAVTVIDKVDEIDKGEPADLKISAWPNRGAGGVYYEGEDLVIHFKANRDCYLKIYHIDVNGKMALIFPNKFHHNNFITKDRVYSIPESYYGFVFRLGAPYGTEFIKVVASPSQFKEIEESFTDMGQVTTDKIANSLTTAQKNEGVAEELFSYTIIEKP
jgi:TolB-like protein